MHNHKYPVSIKPQVINCKKKFLKTERLMNFKVYDIIKLINS